ncbi:MAG: cellulase family glycosylhydrolase [Pirellulales bacterium]|nr:cellulase family glycosylhydrolase [Pirellulales bacterium]
MISDTYSRDAFCCNQLSRRRAIQMAVSGAAALYASLSVKSQAAESSPETSTLPKPTMHNYDNYGWLRGFNVVPSWAARIEQAWLLYNPQHFRDEIGLAQQVHANCIRLWIEFSAWMSDPDLVTGNFMDAVAALDEAGMKTMPCLFNRWHNPIWDYGGTYLEAIPKLDSQQKYLEAIVRPLVKDERILVWDLCNEPKATNSNHSDFHWLKAVAQMVREIGVCQPITIGTIRRNECMVTYAPLMDVLCGHPYARTRSQLIEQIKYLKSYQQERKKPLLVNECIPGCLDDLKRAKLARDSIELLSKAGFGWMGWSLKEGKAISTRRDIHDTNGIDGQGFHAWFNADDSLRKGLEFLKEPPELQPPWKS